MTTNYEHDENPFNNVAYRMDAEGFDYCFDGYSNWDDVIDPTFHELRLKYLAAKLELEQYVEANADEDY